MDKTILGSESEQTTATNLEQHSEIQTEEAQITEQTSTQKPQEVKILTENGGLSENWRDALPEEIKAEKCLDNIKTFGTLVKSYVSAQKAIGSHKVAIPGESATADEWDAFYKATGRPETADGYKLDGVKLPEGITLDEAEVKEFQEYAYKQGLSQKDYEAVLAYDAQRVQKIQQSIQSAAEAEYNDTIQQLQTEYGDRMNTVVAQCNKALDTFGLTEVFRDKGLLNNFTIIKALAGIGERISESKLVDNGDQSGGSSPAERLAEIQGNTDDPYYNREHPAHNARVAEVKGLLAAIAKTKEK